MGSTLTNGPFGTDPTSSAVSFYGDPKISTYSQSINLIAGLEYNFALDIKGNYATPSGAAGGYSFMDINLIAPDSASTSLAQFGTRANIPSGDYTLIPGVDQNGLGVNAGIWSNYINPNGTFTALSTGTYTLQFDYVSTVPGPGIGADDIAIDRVYLGAVPEPSSALLLAAVGALGLRRRRK